jgi:hypothetical protein
MFLSIIFLHQARSFNSRLINGKFALDDRAHVLRRRGSGRDGETLEFFYDFRIFTDLDQL